LHTYTIFGNQVVKLTAVNEYSCTGFNPREIIIAADPHIPAKPVGKVVCEGDRYLFSASINDRGATYLSYQWYFNSQPVSNNNEASYAINAMSTLNQ